MTWRALSCLACVVTIALVLEVYWGVIHTVGYATRPLWDKPRFDSADITRLAYRGYANTSSCQLYGVSPRNFTEQQHFKIFDCFTFSVETDLVEIRLAELYEVVDHFIIVEAARTFTRQRKRLLFQENRHRFEKYEDKITYILLDDQQVDAQADRPVSERSAFDLEGAHRRAFWRGLRQHNAVDGDVVMFSDADEIPRRDVVRLFRNCQIPYYAPPTKGGRSSHNTPQRRESKPDALQAQSSGNTAEDRLPGASASALEPHANLDMRRVTLELRTYFYSFEFTRPNARQLRTVVEAFRPGMIVSHSLNPHFPVLSVAGWHCSWCFRYVEDLQFKMRAYSHFDRGERRGVQELDNIQRAICDGTDVFNMFPSEHSWRELIYNSGPMERQVGLSPDLPELLRDQEHFERFSFLLPGGCVRDHRNESILLRD